MPPEPEPESVQRLWVSRGAGLTRDEPFWEATGGGKVARPPLREGAIAAWRKLVKGA